MVAVELLFIFYVGEIIGKGSLVGYNMSRVKPTFPFSFSFMGVEFW
jgi:hypothetical protein